MHFHQRILSHGDVTSLSVLAMFVTLKQLPPGDPNVGLFCLQYILPYCLLIKDEKQNRQACFNDELMILHEMYRKEIMERMRIRILPRSLVSENTSIELKLIDCKL